MGDVTEYLNKETVSKLQIADEIFKLAKVEVEFIKSLAERTPIGGKSGTDMSAWDQVLLLKTRI